MNGRVYDPALGRFISADPYLAPPWDGQGLNRYAYALNNPLAYTDPSGFDAIPCATSPEGHCAQVTVIERRESVGGNAGSFLLDGVWCDFGSHRFHPAAGPGVLAEVKALLGIPEELDLLAILPFGYPTQSIGQGKKRRKPLSEVASRERFGKPFE